MGVVCGNCGRVIALYGGTWQHVWRIKLPGAVPAMGGSPVCAWRGQPPAEIKYAEPADEQKASA
jgi:hypothetical protein